MSSPSLGRGHFKNTIRKNALKKGIHPKVYKVRHIYSNGAASYGVITTPVNKLIYDLDISNSNLWTRSKTSTYEGFGGRARNFKRKYRFK